MKVTRLVIHQLEKEAKKIGIDLYHSSNALMPLTPAVDRMFEVIHESFEKDKTRHCKFKLEETSNSVLLNTNRYFADTTDALFLKYTKASLDTLASLIKNEIFATGGYYLFADYVINNNRFMTIILARKKDGFNVEFNAKAENFEFKDTENINTDKLAMGYRLNVGLYENRETIDRNYMALLTNQGDKLSDYFITWVNASEAVNGKVQTGILVNAIKHIGPIDPLEDAADFQTRAYNYIYDYKKANKGLVNIDNISEFLYGEKDRLRKYVEEKLEKEIDPDIRPDASYLKTLIQIKAEVAGIKVSIDSSKFGDSVTVVKDALVIKNQHLINQIQAQRLTNE